MNLYQIFIVGVPLLVIVYNDPSAYFFVWCGIIFIVCTTILLLIFVPKMIRWNSGSSNANGSASRSSMSRFSSKWTSTSRHSQTVAGGGIPTASRASSAVSDVTATAPARVNKLVSFASDSGNEFNEEKLEELKGLIMAEHNIDITSIIRKIDGGAEEAVLVTADAPPTVEDDTKAEKQASPSLDLSEAETENNEAEAKVDAGEHMA